MNIKFFWDGSEFISNRLECFIRYGSIFNRSKSGRFSGSFPLLGLPFSDIKSISSGGNIGFFHDVFFLLDLVIELLFINNSLFNKSISVEVNNRLVLFFNNFVHDRLGELGLVKFIVSKSSIANDINNNIFFKFLSEVKCKLHNLIYQFRFIRIYMKNWTFNWLGYFTRMCSTSVFSRCGCKTNLIIYNHMKNTMTGIPL